MSNNFELYNHYNDSFTYSSFDGILEAREYLQAGTLSGAESRGSSIIGDGLASCIPYFGELEEERTRIIIFTTDNDLAGNEIVTIMEQVKII